MRKLRVFHPVSLSPSNSNTRLQLRIHLVRNTGQFDLNPYHHNRRCLPENHQYLPLEKECQIRLLRGPKKYSVYSLQISIIPSYPGCDSVPRVFYLATERQEAVPADESACVGKCRECQILLHYDRKPRQRFDPQMRI